VNIHQHARLTPWGRASLVARLQAGEKVSMVARSLDVSRHTVYKWRRRFLQEGESGLRDRSSRPHSSPRRISQTIVRAIHAKRAARWSSIRIARSLEIPLSTVLRTLKRAGLSRLPPLQPRVPVVRYERARAGELLHLDTKKLARITRVGKRIHGDPRHRRKHTGWETLYVAIDDATRLAYLEVLSDERGQTARGFLQRAAHWYEQQGIRTERVMTDNGKNFIAKDFTRALSELGARHVRTRPYTPRTNGKAERLIQTCLREWAYAEAYPTSEVRTAALDLFLAYYNQERPHLGIRGLSPQQRLQELRCEQRP